MRGTGLGGEDAGLAEMTGKADLGHGLLFLSLRQHKAHRRYAMRGFRADKECMVARYHGIMYCEMCMCFFDIGLSQRLRRIIFEVW